MHQARNVAPPMYEKKTEKQMESREKEVETIYSCMMHEFGDTIA